MTLGDTLGLGALLKGYLKAYDIDTDDDSSTKRKLKKKYATDSDNSTDDSDNTGTFTNGTYDTQSVLNLTPAQKKAYSYFSPAPNNVNNVTNLQPQTDYHKYGTVPFNDDLVSQLQQQYSPPLTGPIAVNQTNDQSQDNGSDSDSNDDNKTDTDPNSNNSSSINTPDYSNGVYKAPPFNAEMIECSRIIQEQNDALQNIAPGSPGYYLANSRIEDAYRRMQAARQNYSYGMQQYNQCLEDYHDGKIDPYALPLLLQRTKSMYGLPDSDFSDYSRSRDFGYKPDQLGRLNQAISSGAKEFDGHPIQYYLGPDGKLAQTTTLPIAKDIDQKRVIASWGQNPLLNKWMQNLPLTIDELRQLKTQMTTPGYYSSGPSSVTFKDLQPKIYQQVNDQLYTAMQKRGAISQSQPSPSPLGAPGTAVPPGIYVPNTPKVPSRKGSGKAMAVSPPPGIQNRSLSQPGNNQPSYTNPDYIGLPSPVLFHLINSLTR